MKRKILFRAQTKDKKQWVYGNLIQGKNDKGELFCQIEISDFDDFAQYDVVPATIGQFSGLTDKNGNKIFEGDILKTNGDMYNENFKANKFLKVEFVDGAFCLTAKIVKLICDHSITIRDFMFQSVNHHQEPEFEVIGNVHDNPELI